DVFPAVACRTCTRAANRQRNRWRRPGGAPESPEIVPPVESIDRTAGNVLAQTDVPPPVMVDLSPCSVEVEFRAVAAPKGPIGLREEPASGLRLALSICSASWGPKTMRFAAACYNSWRNPVLLASKNPSNFCA